MSINKYNPATGELTPIAGGPVNAFCPIGTILPFGGATAPRGYLLCNGAQISKTEYKELYDVIGDAFGYSTDNTKFTLPDLREATTKGAGLSGRTNIHYKSDGVTLGAFIDDRIQDHTHQVYKNYETGATGGAGTTTTSGGLVETTGVHTGRNGTTTEVKAVGVNYIIKAKVVSNESDYPQQDNYSTDEVDTGKVWIDGKKIYRKVLLCTIATPLSASGFWTVVNGWTVSDATIEKYISIDYSGIDYGNRIDHEMTPGTTSLKFYCLSSNVTIPVGAALIIEYTKTT